jgi:putative ABC transport system ATP-binding protein
MELFRDVNREGTTIVMVTHNPDLVPYANRIFGMEKGKLVTDPESFCFRTWKAEPGNPKKE